MEKTLEQKEEIIMNQLLDKLKEAVDSLPIDNPEKNLIDYAQSYKLIHEARLHRYTAEVHYYKKGLDDID